MSSYGKGACIWHAYTALESQNKGEVLKSQLKVLTHNIANCLGVRDAETHIDELLVSSLTFSDYMRFLSEALFANLRESDIRNGNAALDKIDDVCWFVCAPSYLHRPHARFDETGTFKLWRVYNVLAEVGSGSGGGGHDEEPETLFPVRMDWEEVVLLVERVRRILGPSASGKFDRDEMRREAEAKKTYSFLEVLDVVESRHLTAVDGLIVANVAGELYAENVLGVMKQGYLNKKAHMLAWKERWCVLTPTAMYYYGSRDEKDLKGQVVIPDVVSIEDTPDRFSQKSNRIVIHTGHREYEFAALDPRTKTEWLAALQSAVKLQNPHGALSKDEIKQRRISRYARREKMWKDVERLLKEKEEKERAQLDLEQEKRKRSEIEEKMREEELERQRERDLLNESLKSAKAALEETTIEYEIQKQRLKELEELQRELEALLLKEREARERENNARILQEKALQEERDQKKKLEQLQAEMERLLMDEQQKREDLEDAKTKQEQLLIEEQRQLYELEMERERRNREYEEALAKLQQAECEKEEMKRQLEKKKVFIAKFTGEEPIFQTKTGSHRGPDPGAKVGLGKVTSIDGETPSSPEAEVFN